MKTIELILDKQKNYFMREAFNTLRTNILFSGKDIKTIVFTSCFASEGKTTVSIESARSLAENGKKVLFIDADLRKSAMASRYTRERGVIGLSHLLSGQVDADNVIYPTQISNLDVVFAGPYPPNPAELVGSVTFKEFIYSVRERYDYVIIDAAPLGLVIDAAVMASVCDGAILVINAGHVKYRVVQGVQEQLEKSGCRVLGAVLNEIDRRVHSASKDTYYGAKMSAGYYGSYQEGEFNAQPTAGAVAGTKKKQP